MLSDAERLVSQYSTWVRDRTTLRKVGDVAETTTPFFDRHNDAVQIYLQRSGPGLVLTDDGYTIHDLEDSECELTANRQQMLTAALNGFGVRREDDVLTVHASFDTFAQRQHNLVQAILAVHDLFYTSEATVANLFTEDVADWLASNEVRFTPGAKLNGKSGLDQRFDFVIPKSAVASERLVQTLNHANRATAQRAAFVWVDVRELREPGAQSFAFINDSEEVPLPSVIEALSAYDVKPVLWSQRDQVRPALAS